VPTTVLPDVPPSKSPTVSPQRILFLHAHPDDETISTGGTIATLVDAGAAVTVVTATRGELGELVDDSLTGDLTSIRETELASAMRILGVTDHRFLGTPSARWEDAIPRRYLDSGMQWGTKGAEPLANVASGALTSAPFAEIAADIAMVISDTAPDVVISYNEAGGYGHPDHILVGEAAARAANVMKVPFYAIDPNGTLAIDVTAVRDRKRAALETYRSQLIVSGDEFAGANGHPEPITTIERFRWVPERSRTVDSSFSAQTWSVRIFLLVVAALFGGAAGLVLAGATTSGPPVLIAALVATVALVTGLRLIVRSRWLAAVASVFLIATSLMVSSRMTVDPSMWWLAGSAVLAIAAVVVPHSSRSRAGKIIQ
jgi:N-acetyl-1-D-myo-inositol-2-amino-2-deoxy-alpha-D-glucopyranoside deacetylase